MSGKGREIDPIKVLLHWYDRESEVYKILLSHSQDVARLCLEIIDNTPALEQAIDRSFVYEAAMLHDIGIIDTHTPRLGCNGSQPYIRHGVIGGQMLRSIGLEAHALVCERHTGMGITLDHILSDNLPLPPEGLYMPQSVEEKLICFADKFYSKTHLGVRKTIQEARKSVSRHGADATQRFDHFAMMFPMPN